MVSEITEENDGDTSCIIDKEAQKERIRKIIGHQKSLYLSSSSYSSLCSSVASCSSSSSSLKSGSLLEKMKNGGTSLKRLLDMEHTSLANYFEDYRGSPVIRPIYLWGSDTDGEVYDPWASIKQIRPPSNDHGIDGQSCFASEGSFINGDSGFKGKKLEIRGQKLRRKRSFRRLPGFGLWRFRWFRLRLRLKKLKIILCGRKF